MCGIAGIIDFRGQPIERRLLESFCTLLAHRGPDDSGIWQHESAGFSLGFAHSRLAVIDPTSEAHQPMTDASGRYAVTFNGELYNYRALREQLPSPPRTESDTEVMLQACAAWGPAALNRFDAMWALGFIDTVKRKGHLSRDPFGIKPLYYCHHGDRLIFASELKAIRRVPGMPSGIDPDALALYLNLGYIPHPYTIYRDIKKLSPGHVLLFDQNGPKEPQRYHHGQKTEDRRQKTEYEDACSELRTRIDGAVTRQRVADVPLGAFLSGGLDSSVVVAHLADPGLELNSQFAIRNSQSNISTLKSQIHPIKTFSIGYADHPRYDETHYARMVADHFHTEHHAIWLTFRDILDTVEPMLDHLGEPFADSSLLPTSLVSRYTRQQVTVALSGDGGDELFGGYWRYLGHHYLAQFQRIPRMFRKPFIEPLLRHLPSARSTPWLNRLRQVQKLLRAEYEPDAMHRHLAWMRLLNDDQAAKLMGVENAIRARNHIEEMYALAAPPNPYPLTPNPLANILLADLSIGLPGDMLFKVDTASMFRSLEVRVPFLDTDLVDFVTALPIEYKIRGSTGKRILKDAYRSILPDAIINRGKMGFEVPVGEFLRNELRDLYHATVTPPALGDLGLDPEFAAKLYNDHLHRREDHAELLWALLVLCHWHKHV